MNYTLNYNKLTGDLWRTTANGAVLAHGAVLRENNFCAFLYSKDGAVLGGAISDNYGHGTGYIHS